MHARATPGWAPTFADLSALLLAFFVMLVAVSEIDLDRLRGLRDALADEQVESQPHARWLRTPLPRALDVLQRWARRHDIDLSTVPSTTGGETVWVEFDPRASFEPGEAGLTPALRSALLDLADELPDRTTRIEIGGHVSPDFLPDRSFPDATALALARARGAGDFLRSDGGVEAPQRWVAYEHGLPPRGTEPTTLSERRAARRITLLLEIGR